ncbi:Hypothetical predicted protein [Marmota monax]|uniref:Uncharacterized protein n=1 Tax=Marmota monax TaxID=9995 RepID=A0A5E4C912_MARMO|nr:Hypothetical predicted protein [Marmota monax]
MRTQQAYASAPLPSLFALCEILGQKTVNFENIWRRNVSMYKGRFLMKLHVNSMPEWISEQSRATGCPPQQGQRDPMAGDPLISQKTQFQGCLPGGFLYLSV